MQYGTTGINNVLLLGDITAGDPIYNMTPPVINHDRCRTVRTAALRSLTEQSDHPSPEAVRTTTLRALYQHHPHVTLEDVLELRVLIDGPGQQETSVEEQIDAVLETAFSELTKWNTTPPVTV